MINQSSQILDFLRKNITEYPSSIVEVATDYFNVTRTTIHRHLSKLIEKGEVIKTGSTRDVVYCLANSMTKTAKFHIDTQQEEFQVYTDYFKQAFSTLPENVETICHYGFTEIFNNALDHSRGTLVWIESECRDNIIKLTVIDNGVGVFKTIYDFFKLDEFNESVLQLSKGKMTTAPKNHTGEGLFFSCRAFDVLEIYANDIHYVCDNKVQDWAFESYDTSKFGSKIVMTIAINSDRKLIDIFKAYQDAKSLEFNKTEILVKLAQLGQEQLISRSQAKRILRGLETRFTMIILDFSDIKLAGQGFVDEIFRVYKTQHPEIEIQYQNANPDVEFMIKRGITTSQDQGS